MERLKEMKSRLASVIYQQISGDLQNVDTKELGEAIDMIKDISEAMYYCTITEAMEGKSKGYGHQPTAHYYSEPYIQRGYPKTEDYLMYEEYPIMFNGGQPPKYYMDGRIYPPKYHDDYSQPNGFNSYGREDRYATQKRRYLEGKGQNDKQAQMRELEHYTQELASDITDMIKDASPEEKQLLQQKISLLAQKIK